MPPILLAQIAVEAAAPDIYTYKVPSSMINSIKAGQMVLVPLRGRAVNGYVLKLFSNESLADASFKYKDILEIINYESLFGENIYRLIMFMADYYFYPPGLCVKEVLPGGLSPKLETEIKLSAENLEQPLLLGSEKELLEILAETKSLPLKQLLKDGFSDAIKNLLKQNLIVKTFKARSTVSIKYEWWVELSKTNIATKQRLGSEEKRFLELISSMPATPLSYFKIHFKNPLIQAKSLNKKNLITLTKREFKRDDPERAIYSSASNITKLSQEQASALFELDEMINAEQYQGVLLFGVTGSGKTEVYLRSAQKVLEKGKQVLWLTPEISLTLGLEGLLRNHFSTKNIAVLHSALSPGERYDQWLAAGRGNADIVLGARSAIFAPLNNLGLIIVDEEHDWAYKQDDGLKYHGRDMALWRGKDENCVVILGSATPSLESYQGALDGRLKLITMENRATTAGLPSINLLDIRQPEAKPKKHLAPELRKALNSVLTRNEQALFFINRRGLSAVSICGSCGHTLKCPHCDISFTLHGYKDNSGHDSEVLVCHHCGYRKYPVEKCPKCQSGLLRYAGLGTEKLQQIIDDDFPAAISDRLDTDAIKTKGGLKNIITAFAKGEVNVLIGTQMAAKGHDFANLTLVGVVDADLGLNLPDFRAAERSFQLLAQVAGRAGRGIRPGQVIIQTLNPNHYALQSASEHDYESFFMNEAQLRKELGRPPFTKLALLRVIGQDESLVLEIVDQIGTIGRNLIKNISQDIEIFGPAPSPLAKLRNNYRYQIMLSAKTNTLRYRTLISWLPQIKKILPANLRFTLDVDPYHLL